MSGSLTKWTIIVVAIAALCLGAFVFTRFSASVPVAPEPADTQSVPERKTIGRSVEGRAIEAYTFGEGEAHLLFVGGIHGGYEWNSVLLAYEFIDHLESNPSFMPSGLMVTIIPDANPDGTYLVTGVEGRFSAHGIEPDDGTGRGRFNANDVDLNRNFDCKWSEEGVWRGNSVGTGEGPFSEPEARAIRDFALNQNPDAVVFWHSQASAVYASECTEGILPETLDIMHAYARAADYRAVESFDSYPVTGDAEGWLASIGIPAITVELTTHETIEWKQNLAGIEALFDYYEAESGVAW